MSDRERGLFIGTGIVLLGAAALMMWQGYKEPMPASTTAALFAVLYGAMGRHRK